MTDGDGGVTLKDVYDLVDNSRKETAQQIEKVNGDVVEVKVAVGKVETKLDSHDERIRDNTTDIGTLREQARQRLIRTASAGGIAGTIAAIILQIIAAMTRTPTP